MAREGKAPKLIEGAVNPSSWANVNYLGTELGGAAAGIGGAATDALAALVVARAASVAAEAA
jgi:hypothetical protein